MDDSLTDEDMKVKTRFFCLLTRQCVSVQANRKFVCGVVASKRIFARGGYFSLKRFVGKMLFMQLQRA